MRRSTASFVVHPHHLCTWAGFERVVSKAAILKKIQGLEAFKLFQEAKVGQLTTASAGGRQVTVNNLVQRLKSPGREV